MPEDEKTGDQGSKDDSKTGDQGSQSGNGDDTGKTGADEGTQGKTYDETYVKRLRDEAASYRTKLREQEDKLKAIADKDKSELEKANDAKTAAEKERDDIKRMLREKDISLAAVKHNAIHPEVIAKMVPEDADDIDEAIGSLKKQYPALFKKAGSADGGQEGKSDAGLNMNDLLRRAAGRA